jgi:hypothetical protein
MQRKDFNMVAKEKDFGFGLSETAGKVSQIQAGGAVLSIIANSLKYREHLPGRFLPLLANSKKPYLKEWPKLASVDGEQLASWADRHPDGNLGYTPAANDFVLDVDCKDAAKDGVASLAKLESYFGQLPATLTAITPSGGKHLYFRGQFGGSYRSCANAGKFAGIDIRAGGDSAGYVVMPPSVTPSGAYSWIDWPEGETPVIAQAPGWLCVLASNRNPMKAGFDDGDESEDDEDESDAGDDWGEGEDDGWEERLLQLESALEVLDQDDYDLWIAMGQALRTVPDGLGRDLWLKWSKHSPKFDEREAAKKWKGFTGDHTGYPAVFARAKEVGWHNPGSSAFKMAGSVVVGGSAGGKGSALDKAVAQFNETHAVTFLGGAAVVIREGRDEHGNPEVKFLRPEAVATWCKNRTVFVEVPAGEGGTVSKQKSLFHTWMAHPDRRTYEGVGFLPGVIDSKGFYNLWRGWPVATDETLSLFRAGWRCRRFLEHLRVNVCGRNAGHFWYLMHWMSDMLQNPMTKPGVALVLRGKQGTGKSKVADMLRAMLNGYAFKASKSEQIVGRFTSHLANKLLIVAEESFFAGSKADIGALKDLITSNTITLEPKGIDAVEIRSCHRLIMITNNEWAIPAAAEERRYFVLDVGDGRMQDAEYFAAIDAQMLDGGGLAAFFTFLMKMDLSQVNLRKVPHSKALDKQKILSLGPLENFVYNCLQECRIDGVHWGDKAITPNTTHIYNDYVVFAKSQGCSYPEAPNRFAPHFRGLTNAVTKQEKGNERRRYYEIPNHEVTLQHFYKQVGVPRPVGLARYAEFDLI